VLLTRESFRLVFRRATIIAPHREKFFAETVQNSSIHAMVAGNER